MVDPLNCLVDLNIEPKSIGVYSTNQTTIYCPGCGKNLSENGLSDHKLLCEKYHSVFVRLIILLMRRLLTLFLSGGISELTKERLGNLWNLYQYSLFPQ